MSIVIDTGPDFRQQMLRHHITHIDVVLWTHHHFDHIAGLDDLRPFCFAIPAPMPCHTHPDSARVLKNKFNYVFSNPEGYANVPRLKLHAQTNPFLVESRRTEGLEVNVVPVEVEHGHLRINGYRIGNFSYLTDTSHIPANSLDLLMGTDVLVLNALRKTPHHMHYSIGEAIEVAHKIGARRTVFTHLTHDILHVRDSAELPEGITLGFDGMILEVED